MKDNFARKLWLEIGLSAIVIAIMLAATFFFASRISGNTEAIVRLKKEIEFSNQAVASLVILKDEFRQAEQYRVRLKNLLPASGAVINFRREVRELAAKQKIDLGFNFGIETPADAGRLGSVGFEIKASGPAEKFIDFLKGLEALNYFAPLDSVEFNRASGRFNADLGGRVFSR